MSSCGKAEKADCLPERMREGHQDDRSCAERTNQHGESTARAKRVSATHGEAGEPSAADASDGRSDVDDDERQAQMAHIDVETLMKELGQPEEIEPPDGIG